MQLAVFPLPLACFVLVSGHVVPPAEIERAPIDWGDPQPWNDTIGGRRRDGEPDCTLPAKRRHPCAKPAPRGPIAL